MKIQNQIILSIGTNQGDKLANIEQAIHLIHSEIATVVKVSKLYESPSWGFESDAFIIVQFWFIVANLRKKF